MYEQRIFRLILFPSSGGSRGAVWDNCPPNSCGALLKWRPPNKNAPLFGAYRRRNKGENIQSKLNNELHFADLQYLLDGL